jgi:2-dehydropantoate 2-reductase
MKILVLGAGGIGGYFGGRLHQAGADVTFLVREARAQHIAAHGLMLESPKDKATLQVKTVLAGQVNDDYDVVILACKAYDLASSIAAITPAMGAQTCKTCILPLLNGIAHIEALDAAFGKARVMGGACQIAATLTPEGVVKALMPFQNIVWGARHPAQAALAQALGPVFAKTAVGWSVSDNIMLDMWEKLTFLSTLAGMTCLMRAAVGDILAAPGGAQAITRYLDSCIAIATKEGYAPRDAAIERFRAMLSTQGSTLTASMLRDLENGGPVEADHIVGFMLEKARAHGVDDGMLAVAFAHLKAYEVRRGRNLQN